ncbi:P1 family peptidase [Methylocella tundrae]|uniref:Putative enzyme n=1 Tax=Methylocella tundrae TaxID=227605 RepID=A0A4U8YWA0_METTU|nr:P1 family peptidase [Methylocella tundrae]WPP05275.1 P1 family peptidase [Methylocella tundrae]VFU07624.1 putative enzyme [Methylocella tundrae]
MNNLITDIAGLSVGNAQDAKLASGVTAVLFDAPTMASIAVHGGAPGLRDATLLEPGMTVERVDALVLSGGSVYGLDSMGGVLAFLRESGRGFPVGSIKVPIAPGAVLFDLLNGGDKDFGREPLYWRLGYEAAAAAGQDFALGNAGAGYGATTANLKGGLGSASAVTANGFHVGALVAVNAVGSATIGGGPHFWAAPYERDDEFGGLGWPPAWPGEPKDFHMKGLDPQNTTIAIVATDAALTRAEAKRLAIMAHDGMAHALRPAHAAMDGDTIFAAATGRAAATPTVSDAAEIGMRAADCLARAIARAVFEAEALPFAGALPGWREKFGVHEKNF